MNAVAEIKTILFDLDGTLLDTAPDLASAFNQMLIAHHQKPQALSHIRNCISRGSVYLAKQFLNLDLDEKQHQALIKTYFDHYLATGFQDTCIFPGGVELLAYLDKQNIPWGIVTNKLSQHAEPLIKKMAWTQRTHCLVSGDTVARGKPYPDPLLHACQLLNVEPQTCLYVGDDLRDIQAGKAAGMLTAVALNGYIETTINPYDWQADYYFPDLRACLHWLQQKADKTDSKSR